MFDKPNNSELVIGIISAVGTDVSKVISLLSDKLKQFKYSVEEIKVSKDVISTFDKNPTLTDSNEYERISKYMNIGDKLREEDETILMKGAVYQIYLNRVKNSDNSTKDTSPRARVAYIINSIKHPKEVAFLRKIYTSGFHLIGVTDDYKNRKSYLTNRKGMTDDQALRLLNRDDNEGIEYGQKTRDAFQDSDYFIHVSDSSNELESTVFRLLDLLFGNPFITPTFEEYAMFMAYSTSLRSADLSRQIGAVVTKDKEILASGVNDCPKFEGGLYWNKMENGKYIDDENGRDYMLGYDPNKKEQEKIINKVLGSLGLDVNDDNIKKLKQSGIGDLTEYGRVVHSEMEALLMCARNNISCRGASMYVTTFPCHNCAKHIIAAGIKKVIYIEPYPKSKALEFYKNEITMSKDEKNKVQFLHFRGVGPRKYIELFSMASALSYPRKRKDNSGNRIKWESETANLRNPLPVLNYIEFEMLAFDSFQKLLNDNIKL
ncbi:cytidine deaminase [Sedimentibacter sp. zth1]|uniref:anti-phage dCTP deaminase n=1 Tax=Sedimentibacter sp. zth1 TaxID=2816908 RepID=UPI001A915A1A|nr:anti-phage dCTP deaminase [Sedimentibacter sp. zth1]QSX04779.1 cytidine deaminase [Sedimentibacter sp. zth1]